MRKLSQEGYGTYLLKVTARNGKDGLNSSSYDPKIHAPLQRALPPSPGFICPLLYLDRRGHNVRAVRALKAYIIQLPCFASKNSEKLFD